MHGIVLKGLKDFVVTHHGHEAWQAIQTEAGLKGKIYVPVTEYPDEEVMTLVGAASSITDTDVPDLLEEFGRFLVTPLLETYGVHVNKDWTGLELVANVEKYIHTSLRAKEISAYTPPELQSGWIESDRVGIIYDSDRKLCHFARGLMVGIGQYFNDPLRIEEPSCMHNGDNQCRFVVSRAGTI
ncbi:heme NO-binding domain-containing protein [Halocatena marina]|uniref:Heme NO-binding domain-containing protein n=1 Tax=Halocatena marina TaxID=2934937 RepID=A0ABD5YR06_9EURY|nr:heme NO-binding domain-containing protein [Halocatena marina]